VNKHDERRMEGVAGMVESPRAAPVPKVVLGPVLAMPVFFGQESPRERFRRRDELDRAFGCGIYAGATEIVLRGNPEEVVEALIASVERNALGCGADCIGFQDGKVVHLCLEEEAA